MTFFKFSLLVLSTTFLASCATDLTDIDTSSSSDFDDILIENTKVSNFDVSVSKTTQFFNIDSGVGTVTINNLENKSLYLVSQNNSPKTIQTEKAMKIAEISAAGRAVFSDDGVISDEYEILSEEELDITQGFKGVTLPRLKAEDSKLNTSEGRAATAYGSYTPGDAVTVGSQKMLYVDSNKELTAYSAKQGKAEYIGKYCIVWSIINDKILDIESIKEIANTFDYFYEAEREIFGKESDKLYIYDGASYRLDDMARHTNTGTKVNIVIYNITNPSVIGYFYCKDYYETEEELFKTCGKTYRASNPAKYSNGGKYFYINYRYADGPAQNKRLAESTLIHEFQHMINYSVKDMNGIYSEDWYNEMLSMLAEDMFSTQINSGSKAPAVMRMNTFRNYYYKSGLKEFSTTYSYGTAYAFGAWLVRNFGGADLVRLIMSNRKANEDSIIDAVNTLSSKKYTFDSLFNEYVKECTNDKGFNISVLNDELKCSPEFTSINSTPIVRPVSNAISTSIGPYGFVLRKIDIKSPSITINLSERTARETVYVIVK